MTERFETTISSKGQVVISKAIREEMGLKPNQKLLEHRRGLEIVLRPLIPISKAKGMLKDMENEPTKISIREVKKGWK